MEELREAMQRRRIHLVLRSIYTNLAPLCEMLVRCVAEHGSLANVVSRLLSGSAIPLASGVRLYIISWEGVMSLHLTVANQIVASKHATLITQLVTYYLP